MANFNFNKVILGGKLTRDPELKTTASGISVTTFTVAINRRAKQGEEAQADFINCTAWKQTAELVTKFFRKGSSICVVGSIRNRSYTAQDGQNRSVTEVVVDEVQFVDSKAENPAQAAAPAPSATYIPEAYISAPSFNEIAIDDELPF